MNVNTVENYFTVFQFNVLILFQNSLVIFHRNKGDRKFVESAYECFGTEFFSLQMQRDACQRKNRASDLTDHVTENNIMSQTNTENNRAFFCRDDQLLMCCGEEALKHISLSISFKDEKLRRRSIKNVKLSAYLLGMTSYGVRAQPGFPLRGAKIFIKIMKLGELDSYMWACTHISKKDGM